MAILLTIRVALVPPRILQLNYTSVTSVATCLIRYRIRSVDQFCFSLSIDEGVRCVASTAHALQAGVEPRRKDATRNLLPGSVSVDDEDQFVSGMTADVMSYGTPRSNEFSHPK